MDPDIWMREYDIQRVRAANMAEAPVGLEDIPDAAFGQLHDAVRMREALRQQTNGTISALRRHHPAAENVGLIAMRYEFEEQQPIAHVHWISVHPDLRRQGLGAMLLESGLSGPRMLGVPEVVASVDDHRLGAIGFFLRFGFLPVYQVNGVDHRHAWSKVMLRLLGRAYTLQPRAKQSRPNKGG